MGGESWDDGNTTSGDGWSNWSVDAGYTWSGGSASSKDAWTTVCGDGKKVLGKEACEDGNTASGDGWNSTCYLESGYSWYDGTTIKYEYKIKLKIS